MKSLLLELNEFNEDLLHEAGEVLGLKNIQRLFTLYKTKTHTDDTYESEYLEPWVQWVSVHTGIPSSQHQIKHLGDVPEIGILQLWEKLSEQGISSGIWGAMNAKRRGAKNCRFFLPDPWTASESGFPAELDALLKPLRYTSKNYTDHSPWALISQMGKLLRLFGRNGLTVCLTKELLSFFQALFLYRAKPFVFVSLLDTLSAQLFLQYQQRYNPDFSLLFLNSIAHLQHHQWKNTKIEPKDPLAYGFRKIDQILGTIFHQMKPDLLMVTNALSQQNTNSEKPWILYRQIDHSKFLRAVGIEDVRVESHMTHDAHLFFPSLTLAQKAKAILQEVRVEGAILFSVESYTHAPLKLFYRIQLTDALPKEARLTVSGKSHPFFALFTAIVRRTGKHIQTGTLFCNQPCFPARLANHELCDQIFLQLRKCANKQAGDIHEPAKTSYAT